MVAVGYFMERVARGKFRSQLIFLLPVPWSGAK